MTLEQIIIALETVRDISIDNYPTTNKYIYMKNGDSYNILDSLDSLEYEINRCRKCIEEGLGECELNLIVRTGKEISYHDSCTLITFPEEVSHFTAE